MEVKHSVHARRNGASRVTAATLLLGVMLCGLTLGTGGCAHHSKKPSAKETAPKEAYAPGMYFNRVASFPVCAQVGASCEADDETAAEIITSALNGRLLVYTNSPKEEIGFIDITTPSQPKAFGHLAMGGEPTSVAMHGDYAMVAVNTSESYVKPSGTLVVVDVVTQKKVTEIPLPGQPDSVASSKDGRFAAIAIESERDEDKNDGAMPQLPGGSLAIVDTVGAPSTWKVRIVDLTALAKLYPTDPEPEYVDINAENHVVVTMQENNHIAVIDLASGKVVRHFSAGSVDLFNVDGSYKKGKPSEIKLTEEIKGVMREPDGVTWISDTHFVTANEGDLDGGSRGFTIFDTEGNVAFDAGNRLEHLVARIGHHNDSRAGKKGNEPENAEFGKFDGTDYLFVNSERSSVIAVFEIKGKSIPVLKQVLPAGLAPEGVLAIPERNLLAAASEGDSREDGYRSVVNIYEYQSGTPAYPTIQSANDESGKPLPWGALSGLAADPKNGRLYAVEDSFYKSNRIFVIDPRTEVARIESAMTITDQNGVLAGLAASLPQKESPDAFDAEDLKALINKDGSVNIDAEGVAVAKDGGFWLACEGAGTIGDEKRPITSANMLLKTDAAGVIEQAYPLPAELNAKQSRFGLEGVAESGGRVVTVFQRPWGTDKDARIGILNPRNGTWTFAFYPLDKAESPHKSWVGLSDIAPLGKDRFLVVERDNQAGPDARVKRLYRIDLAGVKEGQTVTKTLVRDLMADLRSRGGSVIEKVEGVTVNPTGQVFILTDNDGVKDNSGETLFLRLGPLPELK